MPPPPVKTRASGSRTAVEWYWRCTEALAKVRQEPVAGFHSSAAVTPVFRLTNSLVDSPPVSRAVPSASMVRLACLRGVLIDEVDVATGWPEVESTITAVPVGRLAPFSSNEPPPVTNTLPGS